MPAPRPRADPAVTRRRIGQLDQPSNPGSYEALHARGLAHSIECWQPGSDGKTTACWRIVWRRLRPRILRRKYVLPAYPTLQKLHWHGWSPDCAKRSHAARLPIHDRPPGFIGRQGDERKSEYLALLRALNCPLRYPADFTVCGEAAALRPQGPMRRRRELLPARFRRTGCRGGGGRAFFFTGKMHLAFFDPDIVDRMLHDIQRRSSS